MSIEFDPAKRLATLEHRGLDMGRAGEVFAGPTLTVEDDRRDYGEVRLISIGFLDGPDGRPGLDAAFRRAAHHLDEEGQ